MGNCLKNSENHKKISTNSEFDIAEFDLLDPDPYIEYGSGSRRRFEHGSV